MPGDAPEETTHARWRHTGGSGRRRARAARGCDGTRASVPTRRRGVPADRYRRVRRRGRSGATPTSRLSRSGNGYRSAVERSCVRTPRKSLEGPYGRSRVGVKDGGHASVDGESAPTVESQ